MTNLLNIPIKTDKHRGILSIYILHSLKKKPKSGYELLAEIKEKTEGTWNHLSTFTTSRKRRFDKNKKCGKTFKKYF